MLKKIGIVLLAIALMLSSAGCNPSTGEKTGSSSKTDSTNQSTADDSGEATASEAEDEDNTSSGPKTVTTVVERQEIPTTETTEMKYEYTLEGDTSVKDEIKLGKYKYVWGDEFNDDTLDLTKWQLQDDLNFLYDLKSDGDVVMENGCLNLVAERYYDPYNDAIKFKQSYHVVTQKTMAFRHGYLEFRAKVPLKKGMWPSVWFQSRKGTLVEAENTLIEKLHNIDYMVECNIFEVHGSLDTVKPNIHKWYNGGLHVQGLRNRNTYVFEDTTFLPEEYHIYGFLWTDEEISMYVDGYKYQSWDLSDNFDGNSTMKGFTETFWNLRLENDVITDSTDSLDVNTVERMDSYEPGDLPAVFSFDWIRLYQCYTDGSDSAIRYTDKNGKVVSLP